MKLSQSLPAVFSICVLWALYVDNAHSEAGTRIKKAEQTSLACISKPSNPFRIAALVATNDESQPLDISADSADTLLHEQVIKLDGNVQIVQGKQNLSADQASYHLEQGDLEAIGNVFMTQNGIQIAADQINYNMQQRTGQAQQARYQIQDISARGQAEHITILDAQHSQYRNISYTTCQPGNDAWVINADAFEIDQAEGAGTAHNATLSFMDIPIAYLPWMTFPVDSRRRSGLLVPSIGYGEKNGLDLTLPYYLNLAPNYDLTLLPRIISERGLMLGSEFRFLTASTNGMLRTEYLPKDNKNVQYSENRGSFWLNTKSRLNSQFSSHMQIEHVSDDDYLDDLGNQLSISTESLLQRQAELRYQANDWNITAQAKNYQVLNDASKPYDIIPQIKLDMQTSGEQSELVYHLNSEITHFAKNGESIEGSRFDIYPAVSLPTQEDYYHLIPKIGARYTQYTLDSQTDGLDASPDRFAGIFSLDAGLYFARDTHYFGQAAQQTLEPRIFYLYTSRHDQNDIPLFDTSLYGFGIGSLFRENRFNSVDRLGDANQISLGITTRYTDSKTGQEKFKASLGQIFYLQDREIGLTANSIEQQSNSDIAGEFTAYFDNNWQTRGNLIWNTIDQEIDQASAQINYHKSNDQLFNISYRLRGDATEQIDLSGIWPIGKNVKVLAHIYHSLEEQKTQEAIAGLEYGSCCWKIRTLVRQYRDSNDIEDLAFFVQLELNGLGKLGDDFEKLLTDSIYGYRRDD